MTLIPDKQRALELITRIVDNEASFDEKTMFLRFIEAKENRNIKQMYLSEKLTKQILSCKLKREKAPKKLYDFLHKLTRTSDF